jgi:hypothetical protein
VEGPGSGGEVSAASMRRVRAMAQAAGDGPARTHICWETLKNSDSIRSERGGAEL